MYPEKWTPEDPSFGQSDVSAAILHLVFGGRVKMGLARPKFKHFWNFIPPDHPKLDICGFPEGTVFEITRNVPIKAILCDIDTKKRFVYLKAGIINAGYPLSVDDTEFLE